MQIEVAFLEALAETRRYPALLARLGGVARKGGGARLQVADVFTDVLMDALAAEGPAEQFSALLEDGEIAAAQRLLEFEGFERNERIRVTRRAIALQQELTQVVREVMGLCLLLKDVTDGEVVASLARVKAICEDSALRTGRPGWVIRALQGEQTSLEAAIGRMRQEILQEKRRLESQMADAHSRDLSLALERLEQLLQSRESLPTAQHMLRLARRAAEGTLNRDDLQALHRSSVGGLRFVRPWADFDREGLEYAPSIVHLLRDGGEDIVLISGAERQRARELFEALSPQGRGLEAELVAERLREFLNLGAELRLTGHSGAGSIYSFSFCAPRVPAFRAARFQGGLQLVIPRRADASTFARLLKELPEHCLPILYYPGKLEKDLTERYRLSLKLAIFDNLDLLRLCEVPDGQRETAFQQIILPRAPFSQVKPWQFGGPVSAEMFRGRQAIIDRLKRSTGGTILFSGRMMGKSSILERIYLDIEEDHSRPKHRAIKISNTGADLFRPLVENLASLLDTRDAKYARRQIDGLQFTSTLTPAQRNERARQRLDLIRKLIAQFLSDPEARLYVMIDEADQFAAADAQIEREYSLAWLLRDIEFEAPERIRVIFAGFQAIHDQVISQNGAFANWYGLEQLGSLEKPDAEALVIEPFADFGFVFSSSAGIDRILEFTGNHPLLIQEVCARLMDRMCARRTGDPRDEVLTIEAGDVEVVCRDDQLRDRLRQVLSHNLNEYRRLKLMVYLILDSCGTGLDSTLQLEEFSMAGLKAELINWYGEDFNEYFGEKNVGALLSRLKALGLLRSHGATYQFANRTFATMLMEEPAFEQELAELLAMVTNPDIGQPRRFVTLPTEHLERIVHNRQHDSDGAGHARQNMLFIGLPGTDGDYVAEQLFAQQADSPQRSYLISGAGCAHISELRERLMQALREQRKTLSLADFMVKNNLQTLVIRDADQLAWSGHLVEIAQSLNQRDRQVFAFGGAPLARAYVRELLAWDFDVVYLERLRPQDIKVWGNERLYAQQKHVVTFDDNTAREVRRVTGGYLPLIHHFARSVRERHQSAKEYFPSRADVDRFASRLDAALIEQTLLATLMPPERQVLQALYEYAAGENNWEMDADWVKELLMPHLVQQTGLALERLYDMLDIFQMLDLLTASNIDGMHGIILDPNGPLTRLWMRDLG